MTSRQRKLIGAVALLVWITIYVLMVLVAAIKLQLAGRQMPELLFSALVGLLWVPLAMVIVWWMQKPDAPPSN